MSALQEIFNTSESLKRFIRRLPHLYKTNPVGDEPQAESWLHRWLYALAREDDELWASLDAVRKSRSIDLAFGHGLDMLASNFRIQRTQEWAEDEQLRNRLRLRILEITCHGTPWEIIEIVARFLWMKRTQWYGPWDDGWQEIARRISIIENRAPSDPPVPGEVRYHRYAFRPNDTNKALRCDTEEFGLDRGLFDSPTRRHLEPSDDGLHGTGVSYGERVGNTLRFDTPNHGLDSGRFDVPTVQLWGIVGLVVEVVREPKEPDTYRPAFYVITIPGDILPAEPRIRFDTPGRGCDGPAIFDPKRSVASELLKLLYLVSGAGIEVNVWTYGFQCDRSDRGLDRAPLAGMFHEVDQGHIVRQAVEEVNAFAA